MQNREPERSLCDKIVTSADLRNNQSHGYRMKKERYTPNTDLVVETVVMAIGALILIAAVILEIMA